MLKMETKNGVTTVKEKGKVKFVGTVREAWQYASYRRFIALVRGVRISYRVDKHNYIRSLVPPMKKIVVYTMDKEAVEYVCTTNTR